MRTWAAVLIGFLVAWALALGQTCPTVCVIIPEEDRCVVPRPVPDPACETAIIRAFLSYGFHVVDQQQVKFLRFICSTTIEWTPGHIPDLAADTVIIHHYFLKGNVMLSARLSVSNIWELA